MYLPYQHTKGRVEGITGKGNLFAGGSSSPSSLALVLALPSSYLSRLCQHSIDIQIDSKNDIVKYEERNRTRQLASSSSGDIVATVLALGTRVYRSHESSSRIRRRITKGRASTFPDRRSRRKQTRPPVICDLYLAIRSRATVHKQANKGDSFITQAQTLETLDSYATIS